MQQSIEVLLLPLLDLAQNIEQELQNNPLLEIDDGQSESSSEPEAAMPPEAETANQTEYISSSNNSTDDEPQEEIPIKREVSLEENLLRQLRVEYSDPFKIIIGEFIIGNLNEDGYLKLSTSEIAEALNISDPNIVEEVLKVIHSFEPLGIAARNLEECLLTQAQQNFNGNGELAKRIITGHLEDLGGKKYSQIARQLSVSLDEIKKAAQLIASLEPRPARNHRSLRSNTYIKPDVQIIKDENNGHQIYINQDGIPHLRVNPVYKKMLNQKNLTPEEKNFIREKMKNAIHFIQSIEQRGQTIRRITECILERQKDFFGDNPAPLAPMTLREVAQLIDRNESTVSRAVHDKYVATPKGLYPIKFFFASGIPERDNKTISSRSIKDEIKDLIAEEGKNAPLSDQDIQNYFEKKGLKIARRTISKYRQGLRILPSHLRKE